MIKYLKLNIAIVIVALGVVLLIVSKIMEDRDLDGGQIVLGISGVFLIIGSLMFLYPILFAKKVDVDGKKVELTPIAKDNDEVEDKL